MARYRRLLKALMKLEPYRRFQWRALSLLLPRVLIHPLGRQAPGLAWLVQFLRQGHLLVLDWLLLLLRPQTQTQTQVGSMPPQLTNCRWMNSWMMRCALRSKEMRLTMRPASGWTLMRYLRWNLPPRLGK